MCQDQLGQLKTGAHLQETNEAGQLAGQSFIYRKYKMTYKKRQVLHGPTVESATALCVDAFPLSQELSWHCIIHTFTPHSTRIVPEIQPTLKATAWQRGHSGEWAAEIETDGTGL